MKKRVFVSAIFLLCSCYFFLGKYAMLSYKKLKKKQIKFFLNYRLTNQWLVNIQKGKKIGEYIEDKGYSHVAIYGLGDVGKHLLNELKQQGIMIDFGIDQSGCCDGLDIFRPEENLPYTELIIVTIPYDYGNIKEKLKICTGTKVINIESIIFDM